MRGVEGVHRVFEQDSATDGLVPEPVVGAQLFVARVVLVEEPLRRPEHGVREPRDSGEQWVVPQHVVDDDHAAGLSPGVDDRPRVSGRGRERLLAEDVLSRPKGRDDDGGVRRWWRRDHHDVDVVGIEHPGTIVGHSTAVGSRELLCPVAPLVGHRVQPDAVEPASRLRHHRGEAARTDDSQTERSIPPARRAGGHPLTPDPRSEEVKCRWNATKSATAGAASTTAPARIAPKGLLARPAALLM